MTDTELIGVVLQTNELIDKLLDLQSEQQQVISDILQSLQEYQKLLEGIYATN